MVLGHETVENPSVEQVRSRPGTEYMAQATACPKRGEERLWNHRTCGS